MHNIILTFFCLCVALIARAEIRLIPVGLGYSNTSVNATIFRRNSIVSHNGWQFVAYYDTDGYVSIARRKLVDKTFVVTRTQYKGNVTDAHNIISIGIDGDGYLHVAFDHHNNKLHYAKSIEPYSTILSDEQSMTGIDEEKVTYPEFYTMANGDLVFVYRSGKSGQGNLVMNRYNHTTHTWTRLHDNLIDGQGKRNAYWQMCVDPNGVIHLSWVWRETWLVETNHDMCYAASSDGGQTWHRSNGEKYELPINIDNAEYVARIPQNSELINQTSIAADNHSRPYIASYWKAANDLAPQYKVIYKQQGEWTVQNASHRTKDFSLSGGGTKMIPMSRPQIAVMSYGNGEYNEEIGVALVYRDAESGSKVTIAYNVDMLNNPSKWGYLQPIDNTVDAWEPSYDTNLWNTENKFHIFVQRVSQGDGEKVVSTEPQMIYILEEQ